MRYCLPFLLFSLPYSIVAARRQARRFFKSKKQGILKAGLLTTCFVTVALIAVDRLTSHGRHIRHRKIILPLETSKQVEVSELISKNHSVPQKFCPEAPAGMSLSKLILLWFLAFLELCPIHSQHYIHMVAGQVPGSTPLSRPPFAVYCAAPSQRPRRRPSLPPPPPPRRAGPAPSTACT